MPNTYKELTAPELVSQWKRLVGGETMNGRDAHMLRKAMDENGWSPVQILLGMYKFKNTTATSVPIFLRYGDWLVEEPFEAEILLAREIAGYFPENWFTYWDLCDTGVESAIQLRKWREAKWELQQWADRILSQPAGLPRKAKV